MFETYGKYRWRFLLLVILDFLDYQGYLATSLQIAIKLLNLIQTLSNITMKIVELYKQKVSYIKAQIFQTTNIWDLEYNFLNFQLSLVPIRIGWAKLFFSAV